MADEAPVAELTENAVLSSLSLLDEPEVKDDKSDEESEVEDSEEEETESSKEEETEEEEEEEESTEDDKEKLELDDEPLLGVPSRKELLKLVPDLFKKVPALEKVIYREHEFTELFPQMSDAREAAESQKYLGQIREQLLDGNIETIFSELNGANKEAFHKVVEPENLLSTIGKVDNNARLDLLSYVIKNTLYGALEYGKDAKDPESPEGQLALAARILHKYIFPHEKDVTPPAKQVKSEADPKEAKLSQREKEIDERDLRRAVESVSTRVQSKIQSWIEQVIDPKNQMTSYVKKNAVRELMVDLDREMSADKRFGQGIARMYEEVRKANYSDESMSKIRRALLSRAQTLLKNGMIRSKRDEILKDSGKREVEKPKYRSTAAPKQKTSSQSKSDKRPSTSSVNDIVNFLNT